MPNALLTGVSGLLAHQRQLDVVGHNLANMNTHGFKAQRILFSDLLYETIKPAASSNDGQQGGTNPNQIGGGVKVALTDRNFGQGSLENTGQDFDFALNGAGFFTVTDRRSDFYTRAGTFSMDEEGYLVAPGGLHVKRFSSVGEPDGVNPGFQVSGDPRIRIPLGASVEGVVSTTVKVNGNLSAKAPTPSAQTLQSSQPFLVSGSGAVASDLLNAMSGVNYLSGDSIVIEGAHTDGTQAYRIVPVDGTTTFQDLMDEIQSEFPDATARLDSGTLIVEANDTGKSVLNVSLRNDTFNTGTGVQFETLQLQIATEGQDAGAAYSITTAYDAQGGAHELKLQFEKITDDIWNLNVTMDPSEGSMLDGTIENITFNDNGNLISSGPPTVTMAINGIAIPQTLLFDFGDNASAERLTHFNADSSPVAMSNGAPPGVVNGVQVESNGQITGVASNGKVFTLAQLAITRFSNPKGLIGLADNLYTTSLNSGEPEVGEAGAGGRGTIRGGQLEASNVDVASEFTKLIVAQRGFSANARTITVADRVLEELTNIIR